MRRLAAGVTASAAAALLATAPPRLRAQEAPDWTKIEIKTQQVAGRVYMLYGVGGFAGIEQLRKEKVLAAFDARWGGGFLKSDDFIAQVYNSLKGIPKNPQ